MNSIVRTFSRPVERLRENYMGTENKSKKSLMLVRLTPQDSVEDIILVFYQLSNLLRPRFFHWPSLLHSFIQFQ